jgi:hypothetical protein
MVNFNDEIKDEFFSNMERWGFEHGCCTVENVAAFMVSG